MKLYDVRAVARFLDVSERRVRQLRDEKVIAEVRPGLYDLIDTNHRYITAISRETCWAKSARCSVCCGSSLCRLLFGRRTQRAIWFGRMTARFITHRKHRPQSPRIR